MKKALEILLPLAGGYLLGDGISNMILYSYFYVIEVIVGISILSISLYTIIKK